MLPSPPSSPPARSAPGAYPSRVFAGAGVASSRFGSRRVAGGGERGAGGGTYRNSTLLHKGFYDLLAVLAPSPTPPRPPSPTPLPPTHPPARPPAPFSPALPGAYAPSKAVKLEYGHLKKGRRVSKDMIGFPQNPIHVLHASDADQAKELLMSWSVEGVGKIPDKEWARTIQAAIKARAEERQREAVAQVQAALKGESDDRPPLQVLNGLPSSAYASTIRSPAPTLASARTVTSALTVTTVATAGHGSSSAFTTRGSTLPSPFGPSTAAVAAAARPGLLRTNTARSLGRPLPTVPDVDGLPDGMRPVSVVFAEEGQAQPQEKGEADRRPLRPRPERHVVPSLETLEKAASASIFFETLYHGLLKSPTSPANHLALRASRRAALERQLLASSVPAHDAEKEREQLRRDESAWLRERRRRVGVKEFSRLSIIGHGAFGVVSLVRQKDTNELFAMKQLRKSDMLRKCQEGHVRSERDLLAAAASNGGNDGEWIVKLHYSFQDADNLYLVLDFMGGGDLLNLLVEKDIFPEDFTRFYIAEMVLCLESCHKLGYIHRDIKPDNFLLDKNGHLRISDFGLATDLHWAHDATYYEQQRQGLLKRHGIDLEDPLSPSPAGAAAAKKKLDRATAEQIMGGAQGLLTWRDKNRKKLAYSVAGTNSYMAVEVIRGAGYGFECDWWSLGIIMYECLYGYPPFVSSSRQQTRQKILNWKQHLRFPTKARVSREAIDLLQRLLCEPEDRIGSMQPTPASTRPNSHIVQERRSGFAQAPVGGGLPKDDGAGQIKAHPWFQGLDWKSLHLAPAPYQPNLATDADVSHFDADIPDEPLAPAGGPQANATKDPILRHKVHGGPLLEIRKQKAFAGFTYKSPRKMQHPSSEGLFDDPSLIYDGHTGAEEPSLATDEAVEGHALVRPKLEAVGGTRSRAISL